MERRAGSRAAPRRPHAPLAPRPFALGPGRLAPRRGASMEHLKVSGEVSS